PAVRGEDDLRLGSCLDSDVEDFQHLVAVVIDHLNGDLAGFWPWERTRLGAIERLPRCLIDLRGQRSFEALEWIDSTGEVAMAHKEGLAVVGRVDHPHRNSIRAVTTDIPRGWVVKIYSPELDSKFAAGGFNCDG